MNVIRAFFTDFFHLFLIFKKEQGRLSPIPPASWAPEEKIGNMFKQTTSLKYF